MPLDRIALAKDFLLILVGSLLLAIGYSLFIAPLNIVPGGVYGLSIVINHITKDIWEAFPHGLPVGKVALVFNIPLFLLAARSLGHMSAIKTVITFVLVAVFTDLIADLSQGRALVQDDPILCSFYGGALLGVGVYLIFFSHSTCAGTDTLARVLSRRTNMKVSSLIIGIDSIVVLLGLISFGDWKVPLYSWLTIFIYGKVVEVLQPQNPHKAVFIISDKPQEIRDALVGRMGVRGTFLHGKGMYQGLEREVIFIIIQRKNLLSLKREVLGIDPKAFISTSDASNDTMPTMI
ncbi:YitT family protein [Porphyromonas sp. COT-239 OH1446]|uniref:YitT family protein n=1 Tax=Porphyromonas sp. COT-239 OH1446 TaxID=1515613 RepID=UPI00052CDEFF|nr:YitT family protein [Porphyromonas sp. COT-239 OH1446]KGN72145.1 hypothetical protein HQ37_00590 [Porphyromonas sp. COT-239 OH1446]